MTTMSAPTTSIAELPETGTKIDPNWPPEVRACRAGLPHRYLVVPWGWDPVGREQYLQVRCSACGHGQWRPATRAERDVYLRENAANGGARSFRRSVKPSRRRLFARRLLVGLPAGIAIGALVVAAVALVHGNIAGLGFAPVIGVAFLAASVAVVPELITDWLNDRAATEAYVAAYIGEAE